MKWHPRSFPKYCLSETCQSCIKGLSQVWVSVVQWLKEVYENIWISIDIDIAMQYSYCMCKVTVWNPKNKKISRNEEKGDDTCSLYQVLLLAFTIFILYRLHHMESR